jgi:hypothetical protein
LQGIKKRILGINWTEIARKVISNSLYLRVLYGHKKRDSLPAYPFLIFFHPLTTAGIKMNNTTKYGIREDKSKKSFAGIYLRLGAKLTHTDEPTIRLVIGTRLKTTKHKPKHFLLLMEGRNKPAIYFSSMYPTQDPNMYEIEHEGVNYILTVDSEKAEMLMSNQIQQVA